jgi:GDP-4-dehydro-6-deoxy-D-mannose reductase
MSESILITGITGFVGSHLADFILKNHPTVELWGTKRYHLSRMDHVRHIQNEVNWVDCNLTDSISVRSMMDKVKPDRIFHCAAESFVSPSWDHPSHYMNINYNATVHLLDALKSSNAKTKFHIPGSGEEYGEISKDNLPIDNLTTLNPVNPYAVTKIAQDLIGYVYFKSYGVNVIRTRAFNHEGPRRDKVFGIPWYAYQVAMIENGLQEPEIKTGHIDDKRNFTHVLDMVEAYWIATEKCDPGKLYLVGSDEKSKVHTFRQALEDLISMSKVNNISHTQDNKYIRPTNVPFLIADISDFREKTGWEPKISYEKILSETLDYWRDRVKDGTA